MAEPATPAPPTPPGGGPRRIRSLPDRPERPRPAGGIRSTPDLAPASTRLPGTDAASYGGDMNWRRGVTVLWILFVLIALGEAVELLIYLAAGGMNWPGRVDIFRLLVVCGGFLALWLGWSWTRWGLASVAFLWGLFIVVNSFRVDYHRLNPDAATAAEGFGALFSLGATLALGAFYLILAAYLIFSVDLIAFTRHRREAGRGWVAVPVGLLVGSYCAAMLSAQFVLHRELEAMRPAMLGLARNEAETLAARWDPASIATFLDPESLKVWSEAGRKNFMDLLRPLGSYLGPGEEKSELYFYPSQTRANFFVQGKCWETVRCTEGHTTLSFTLARPLSGPWRVVDIGMSDTQFYNPPKPAATPTATPVPPPGG